MSLRHPALPRGDAGPEPSPLLSGRRRDTLPVENVVLSNYIRAALHHATYRLLEDGSYFGEIPGFDGVWANAANLETCREELTEVLEEWLLFRVSRQLSLPKVDGLELRISEVA